MENMAKILFKWTLVHPDQRQYRQQAVELEPKAVFVEVDIPADLSLPSDKDEVFLTPQGMAYAFNALEKAFGSAHSVEQNSLEVTEDWGEVKPAAKKESKPAPASDDEDDDWGEVKTETKPTTTADDNTDVPWDETEEKWE